MFRPKFSGPKSEGVADYAYADSAHPVHFRRRSVWDQLVVLGSVLDSIGWLVSFKPAEEGGMLDVQEDEGRLGTVVFDSGHGKCGSPDETGDSETGHDKATDGTAGGADSGGLDGGSQPSLAPPVLCGASVRGRPLSV